MRTNLILLVLAVILAIPTAMSISAERAHFTNYEDVPLLFAGFTRENVATVTVSRPYVDEEGNVGRSPSTGEVIRDVVQMVRDGRNWALGNSQLKGVRVRPELLDAVVFEHLETIRRDEKGLLVEDASAEELQRYGLAEDQAVLIQCFDRAVTVEQLVSAEPIAEILVGRSTVDDAATSTDDENALRGYYVRDRGSNDVVLYERERWPISTNHGEWVDRNPLRFRVDDVIEFALHNERPTDGYTLQDVSFRRAPTGATWEKVVGPDRPVRNGEVRALVQTVSKVEISSYSGRLPDDDAARSELLEKAGLLNPQLWTQVGLKDGSTIRMAIGKAAPDQPNHRYLLIDGVDFMMTIGDWIESPLTRDPEFLFEP